MRAQLIRKEKGEPNRRVFLLSESFVDHAVSTIMHSFCEPESVDAAGH